MLRNRMREMPRPDHTGVVIRTKDKA